MKRVVKWTWGMVGAALTIASVIVGCDGNSDTLSGTSANNNPQGGPAPGSTTTTGGEPFADQDGGGSNDAGSSTSDTGSGNPNPPGSGVLDSGGSGTLEGGGSYSVQWNDACWYSDSGHKYQAMSFTQKSSVPMALEGTLFYNTTCDAKDGTDNLNDTGGTQPSGSWTFWFIHHPDEIQTSAHWWIGDQVSPCIDYSKAPDCN